MRLALRFLGIVSLVAVGACKRHGSSSAPPPPPPQHPVTSSFPPLPTPAASTEAMLHPELGTVGALTIETTERTSVVGARTSDGSFHPHEPIAAASVGAHGEWILALAESGLFLLEGETLAVRARLFADAEGDVGASPDGAMFAFGACEGAADARRCGIDIRAFPDLRRVRFVETDEAARIQWSQDGTEVAVVSRTESSTTIVNVASGTTERYASTGAVNEAAFIGKTAVAYGNDDDTTLVVDRATKATRFDHLATIGHRVRRDQNAVAYDAARDRLYTGGNDNDVWTYEGVTSGAFRALPTHEFANDVSDFVLLPNGDLVVALDSGSLDVLHADGTVGSLIGVSLGSVSYGARIALGRAGDVVGVLGHVVFRWKIGEAEAHQAALFGHHGFLGPFGHADDYRSAGTSIVWIPKTSPDPLRVTAVDLGAPPGECVVVHDGLACFADGPTPKLAGAPTGATAFAPIALPASVNGRFTSFREEDGWAVAVDERREVFLVDAHDAKLLGRLPRGTEPFFIRHDAKSGWTVEGKPIVLAARDAGVD